MLQKNEFYFMFPYLKNQADHRDVKKVVNIHIS